MEAIVVPVVEQVSAPLFSEATKTALIVAGGIVLVGAAAATAYYLVNRDKNPELTKVESALAASLLNDINEVTAARALAAQKGMSAVIAEARKQNPSDLLDNPIAALAAFREIRKN
jgi:hypothetical protein